MRPSARVQSAIELLDEIIVAAKTGGASADRIATDFFKVRRYAGSKDRRAIRNLAWDAIRRFGDVPTHGRAAMVAMADEDSELAALFDGSDHGPAAITPDETRATGPVVPEWIERRIARDTPDIALPALLERAPLDLRINRLKSVDRDALCSAPPFTEVESIPALPDAMRLPTGTRVEDSQAYRGGLIEVQDAGSQMIVQAADAKPGMTVLDLCAGAGGKTLALAAAMDGKGRLIAADTDKRRLGNLPPRAERAGATNIETLLLNPGQETEALGDLAAACDIVLVDAPCSGSGTWRRNPETRWRLTEKRLDSLLALQSHLLDIAAALVAPGGTLVYAVCSLTRAEGPEQAASFASRHGQAFAATAPDIAAGRADGDGTLLTPCHDGTDGFFIAKWVKRH